MSPSTSTAPLTIVEKLEQRGHDALTAVEHAAVWLVGTAAKSEQSLATLTASSPLLQAAWKSGVASAAAHGIPVTVVENVGEEILAEAKAFASALSQPATPPPTAA
jgi:hypothetical protein